MDTDISRMIIMMIKSLTHMEDFVVTCFQSQVNIYGKTGLVFPISGVGTLALALSFDCQFPGASFKCQHYPHSAGSRIPV